MMNQLLYWDAELYIASIEKPVKEYHNSIIQITQNFECFLPFRYKLLKENVLPVELGNELLSLKVERSF